jgi:hypothetical protein
MSDAEDKQPAKPRIDSVDLDDRMNKRSLQDWANLAQILALPVAVVALIIQLVGLANPDWLIGVIGRPVVASGILLIIALLIWVFVTAIAVLRGNAAINWPGGRGSLWSYCALTAVLGVAAGIGLSTKPPLSCEGYGIRIVSPRPGDSVQKEGSLVKGTYVTRPPDGHLVLYSSPLDREHYYPLYEVHLDPLGKTWTGRLGNVGGGDQLLVAAALVGSSGRLLHDHYWQVAREGNAWIPLNRLTEDTIICDEVAIRGP